MNMQVAWLSGRSQLYCYGGFFVFFPSLPYLFCWLPGASASQERTDRGWGKPGLELPQLMSEGCGEIRKRRSEHHMGGE